MLSCFTLFLLRNDFYGRQSLKNSDVKHKDWIPAAKITQKFFSYGKQSLEALCFYSGAFFLY